MNDRQPFLTEDFLKKNKVYFLPRSQDESRLVQEALFQLGCMWVNTGNGYFNHNADPISVVGRTMSTDRPSTKAIFCTIHDFVSMTQAERTFETTQEKTYLECLTEHFNAMMKKIDTQTSEISALREEVEDLKKKISPPTNIFKK